MKKGRLFVMSGPSGCGKGTICKKLCEKEDIFLSVSHTTREIGKDEKDGVTYYYVTKEEFERLIDADEMIEYAVYNGNYYGTSRSAVEKMLEAGRNVMLEIEPQGAIKVKKLFPEALLVFILPPSIEELKRRLEERGRESEEMIRRRLETAKWEIAQCGRYGHIIVNDKLEDSVEEMRGILHDRTSDMDKASALLRELERIC